MGVSDVKPLARGLRAKGSAVAFANSENAKWPVAEVSLSHAFTRVIRLRLPVGNSAHIPYRNAWPMSRCAPMMKSAVWHQLSIEKCVFARGNRDFPPRCARHFPKENLTFTSKPRRRPRDFKKCYTKGEAFFRGMHRPAGPRAKIQLQTAILL